MSKPTDIILPPALKKDAPPPNPNDLAPGDFFCHRMYTPYAMPTPPVPDGRGGAVVQVQTGVAYMKCLKEKCMRWDAANQTCLDNSETHYLKEIGTSLEQRFLQSSSD